MSLSLRLVLALVVVSSPVAAQQDRVDAADAYVRAYATTNNFAGAVRVERRGSVLFERAYGLADRETKRPNTPQTCFHVASVSMQFTAAAAMRLVDAGKLDLDQSVGDLLPGTDGAAAITLRDLLIERSGIPDINGFPDYNELLQHHQTPATLVAHVSGRPLTFRPGSPSSHEEHSAYNALALLIERSTGRSFATAVRQLVFDPLHMQGSFVDDDSVPSGVVVAHGYAPSGLDGLDQAQPIHWSAKAGNGSACTTVDDAAHWTDSLFRGHLLRQPTRSVMFDTVPNIGYGWFRGMSKDVGEAAYHMSGRAPGFASFVLYVPRADLTVVVLSNVYSSATTPMGYDIARIMLDMPYEAFHPHPVSSAEALRGLAARFQFGPTFYQQNGILELVPRGLQLLIRWPTGDSTALIPVGDDRFVDRSYWQTVDIRRDASRRPVGMTYGTFEGTRVADR